MDMKFITMLKLDFQYFLLWRTSFASFLNPFCLNGIDTKGIVVRCQFFKLDMQPGMFKAMGRWGCTLRRVNYLSFAQDVKWLAIICFGLSRVYITLRFFQRYRLVIFCPGKDTHKVPAIFKIE